MPIVKNINNFNQNVYGRNMINIIKNYLLKQDIHYMLSINITYCFPKGKSYLHIKPFIYRG